MKQQGINVGDVAMFLAASLNYFSPRCNENRHISTIKVEQHKEKFGQVRIYCSLGDDDLIASIYGRVDNELRKKCIVNDARHYRLCYLAMASIVGRRVWKSLYNGADFPELLFDTPEQLDANFEHGMEMITRHPHYMDYYYLRYMVDDVGSLRRLLRNVCRF